MSTIEMENPNRSEAEDIAKTEVREVIVVKIGADVSPSDAAKVCRQVMKVLGQLVSNVLTEAVHKGSASAGHPAVQQMYSAAVNAEAAANTLDPPRVAQAGGMPRMPGPGPGMPGGPMGRA